MKKTDVLAYLDKLVEEHKNFYETQRERVTNGIIFCNNENIHVFEGIHILAASADKLLEKTLFPVNDDYPTHRYSFIYKNVELFQLDDDEGFPEVVWNE